MPTLKYNYAFFRFLKSNLKTNRFILNKKFFRHYIYKEFDEEIIGGFVLTKLSSKHDIKKFFSLKLFEELTKLKSKDYKPDVLDIFKDDYTKQYLDPDYFWDEKNNYLNKLPKKKQFSSNNYTDDHGFTYLSDEELEKFKEEKFTFAFITWNDYSPQDVQKVQNFAIKYCNYLIFCYDVAPTTGMKHLHILIALKTQNRFSFLKNNLDNTIHIGRIRKNNFAARQYIIKDNRQTWVHQVPGYKLPKYDKSKFGITKINNSRTVKYQEALQFAELDQLDKIDPEILIKNYNVLKNIKFTFLKDTVEHNLLLASKYGNFFKNHFLWVWGNSGTLKSYNVRKVGQVIYKFYCMKAATLGEKMPDPRFYVNPYIKDNTKWFQNYNYEKLMIIEECDRDFCMRNYSRIKRWFDQYAHPAEIKGSDTGLINIPFIICTSNYSLEECFTDPSEPNKTRELAPIIRRILEVKFTEKAILKWPSWDLLIEEEKVKKHVLKYDKEYLNAMLYLQKETTAKFEELKSDFPSATIEFIEDKYNTYQDEILQKLEVLNINEAQNYNIDKIIDEKIKSNNNSSNINNNNPNEISNENNSTTSNKGKEPITESNIESQYSILSNDNYINDMNIGENTKKTNNSYETSNSNLNSEQTSELNSEQNSELNSEINSELISHYELTTTNSNSDTNSESNISLNSNLNNNFNTNTIIENINYSQPSSNEETDSPFNFNY